jgi:DNA-binding transcriptional LysR family regulator
VRLLEPAGRRVRLTAQADLLIAHTEVLLEEMERAEAAPAQSLTRPSAPRPGNGRPAVCRQAGFEPEARYTSTDLQIHLRLVESGLAAALLPDLSGAGDRHDVVAHRLHGRPRRQIFTTVRRGAARHPKVQAAMTALRAQGARPCSDPAWGAVPGCQGGRHLRDGSKPR